MAAPYLSMHLVPPAHGLTVVKICGLRTAEHALAAATAGADMLGFMFVASSKRQVTPAQASAIIAAVRDHSSGAVVRMVGVFVNEQPAIIDAIAAEIGLDYAQLSGDETPEQAASLRTPWIKAIRLDDSAAECAWLATHTVSPLLVDAHVAGSYGGSGQLADWEGAATLAAQRPLILAGGLTVDNVAAAIARVRPWGVDVSSGVETDGVKDTVKIGAFIAATRSSGQ